MSDDLKLEPAHVLMLCTKHSLDVGGCGWNAIRKMRALLKPEQLVESSWGNYKDQWTDYAKPDFWKESCFDEEASWSFDPGTMRVTVKMSSGDRFSRCSRTWVFAVSAADDAAFFHHLIKPDVIRRLQWMAESERARREEERVKNEIEQIFNQMVGPP